MFEVESEGRLIKIRPASGQMIRSDNGWLVLERTTAIQLAESISQARSMEPMETDEGEDG